MYDIEQLEARHPLFTKHIKRWQFYLDSYLGGDDYTKGEYLTRYASESPDEFLLRNRITPLDNHCKNIIHVYNSFIFGTSPTREFGSISSDPSLDYFLEDADLEGRSFNSFMRHANIFAGVFGHLWIFVDKPATVASTRAHELAQQIRPYVSMVSPTTVVDWKEARLPNGARELSMLKILERSDDTRTVYRYHYAETTDIVTIEHDNDDNITTETIANTLNKIPAVLLYAGRSPHKSIGSSDITDIADIQRAIYTEYSEIEALIKLSNNPSLCKTARTTASAGAGAIVEMPEDLDPGLTPFLLQPSGGNIDAIRNSIDHKIAAIDRIAHMAGVRATSSRETSGVALQVENQLLNARLQEKTDNIELAEEQIWRLWSQWQNKTWDGVVQYGSSFNLRDRLTEIKTLRELLEITELSAEARARIVDQIINLAIDEE